MDFYAAGYQPHTDNHYYNETILSMVHVIRKSGKYIWFNFFNRTVKTTRGSLVTRYIDALEKFIQQRDIKAFRTIEFSEFANLDTTKASRLLNTLSFQQVLVKTKKRLLFRESTNLEHVWGLTYEDLVQYVINQLAKERPEIIEDFNKLQEEKVLTSLDIRHPYTFRTYFATALGAINIKKTKHIDIYYIGDESELRHLIELKESEAVKRIKRKVKQGYNFEKDVEDFFRENQDILTFKCVKISRHARYPIGDDRSRVFDLVLYFRLFLGDEEIKGIPTLIIPIEIKKTDTGQAILLKHLVECQKIFSHNFIPLVITTKPVRSAFDTISLYRLGLLTESDIKKLRRLLNEVGISPEKSFGDIIEEWALNG